MKKTILSLLVTVGLIGSASAQNELINGSFESSSYTQSGQNAVLSSLSSGWTSLSNAHIAVTPNDGWNILPTDGAKMLVFNQENQSVNASIFQQLVLLPNTYYNIIFNILNIAGGYNVGNGHYLVYDAVGLRADVSQNGLVTDSLSYYPQLVGYWYTQTLSFYTTTDLITLSFTDISNETFSIDVGLDNVKVQAVPEPSTYALFGIGAIGLLMVLRRKKTA